MNVSLLTLQGVIAKYGPDVIVKIFTGRAGDGYECCGQGGEQASDG